ncbi:MAG TPA: MarR family transcriptional regulator [Polyangiaceae bacterium]|nr:MarR family transcriptional regulator [Polyangiaceae bacterium]
MPAARRTPSRRIHPGSRATDVSGLGEALEFMRALWEIDHSLRRVSKSMESMLGITGPQRLVIRMVGRFPGIAPGDLASILHVDPSSLTGMLERLRRNGLLSRRSDPEDARRSVLSLTARGRAVDRVRSGTVEAAVVVALKAQPRARVTGAHRVLEAVARELARIR